MQTDELRAELTELANEVAPFAGDLPAIRRRVTRRRVASASVAIVVIAALAIGGVALTRSHPDRVKVAHSVKEVGLADLPRFDAAVVLPANATPADVAHVQATLDDSKAVENYSALPARNLAAALVFSTSASGKALRVRVCAAPSTRSFAVELSRADPRAEQHLTDALGAGATVESIGAHGATDAEVFMKVTATRAQVEAVAQQLQHDADVGSYRYISHRDAYAEFKKLFADQPALIKSETPDGLPESFRIVTRDGVNHAEVAKSLQRLPGVDTVNTSAKYNPAPDPRFTLEAICSSKGPVP